MSARSGKCPRGSRDRAVRARILEANRLDLEAARKNGLAPAMVDRLRLDEPRLAKMAAAIDEVAGLPDPVGAIGELRRRPNGLQVGRMRIPLGVILMVYESRPNVTTDAFALCMKAGNAIILRGGSEAIHSNGALGEVIAAGLEAAGLPASAAQVVPVTDRAVVEALLQREDEIDLCIPRGGEGLIRYVAERSRIPVIKHYKGVCHVFVDAAADLAMALAICENAKVQRPGVCNACETILVHESVAARAIPDLVKMLGAHGVEVRGCPVTLDLAHGAGNVKPATEDDWHAEYLDLIVAVKVVPSFEDAAHIEEIWEPAEAIVTADYATARRFVDECGSSTVLVNASTRFADGGELGLGAEIGISTTRIHAYGPMGLEGLTTTKFVVFGDGQVRN